MYIRQLLFLSNIWQCALIWYQPMIHEQNLQSTAIVYHWAFVYVKCSNTYVIQIPTSTCYMNSLIFLFWISLSHRSVNVEWIEYQLLDFWYALCIFWFAEITVYYEQYKTTKSGGFLKVAITIFTQRWWRSSKRHMFGCRMVVAGRMWCQYHWWDFIINKPTTVNA